MMKDDNSSRASPRLAIVVSHPIQYYSPWFRWMRAHTQLPFRVFYLSDTGLRPARDEKFETTFAWDVDLTTGYDWELVPNESRRPDTLRFNGLVNPGLFPRLKEWNPHAILLFGYKYRTHVRLIAWARRKGIPLIFRGDSHLLGRTELRGAAKLVLRFLYSQFSALTYVGSANREYFRAAGVSDEKLFFAPHAVDSRQFDPDRRDHRSAAERLRAGLEIPTGNRVLLYCAKMIASKQPRELLEAFLAARVAKTVLVLAGDGPEKAFLQEIAGQSPQVRFLPFANQSEMPARYLMADIFALPSRGYYETWGLSINEAMHMGCPCLVSDRVGCHLDLVTDGQTGWVFPAENAAALKEQLTVALTCPQNLLSAMSAAARERVAAYSYEAATTGLLKAIDRVCVR
jgi:glycosyltransferase involved in cell wall biosynthesis